MAEAPAPGTPRRLARSSSSLGVWWKLGDGDASSSSEAERRLRGIAEEEAAVRADMERRAAGAPAARRKIALTSLTLEMMVFVCGLWMARRRGKARPVLKLLLLPALAIPAFAATVLAAFARFRKMLDARDQQRLQRLGAQRKASIGNFRGSHHNLHKLIQKYDPDAGDSSELAAAKNLKRTHSRLSFHVGDE
ncbi:hypothetical protein ACP4OV_000014 [Aristida adscensionis]